MNNELAKNSGPEILKSIDFNVGIAKRTIETKEKMQLKDDTWRQAKGALARAETRKAQLLEEIAAEAEKALDSLEMPGQQNDQSAAA